MHIKEKDIRITRNSFHVINDGTSFFWARPDGAKKNLKKITHPKKIGTEVNFL